MLAPIKHLTAVELAARIVETVRPTLPAAYSVRAERDHILVEHEGSVVGSTDAAAIVGSVAAASAPDHHVETAIRLALAGIQAALVAATGRPWPATEGKVPLPGAHRTGDRVESWFGEPTHPVLQLRPVPLVSAPTGN